MAWAGGDRIVRVIMRATRGAEQQVNTLHYRLHEVSVGESNDVQALADFFRDNVMTPFRLLYRPDWTIMPVVVQDELDPLAPNDPRSGWTSGTAAAGTATADADYLPDAVCVVGTLVTDLIGRRHRGRIFIGGSWGESDQSNGGWNAGAIARAKAYTDAIPREPDISGFSTATADWCVYSRTNRAQSIPSYSADITDVILHNPVRWLRSRQT